VASFGRGERQHGGGLDHRTAKAKSVESLGHPHQLCSRVFWSVACQSLAYFASLVQKWLKPTIAGDSTRFPIASRRETNRPKVQREHKRLTDRTASFLRTFSAYKTVFYR
jgi:hypothetical protein